MSAFADKRPGNGAPPPPLADRFHCRAPAASPPSPSLPQILYGVFCSEILLKIGAEFPSPWRFLTGPEAAWNLFDTAIVVVSTPGLNTNGDVLVLRMVRLLRIQKLGALLPVACEF